jgi:hypothetical protein
MFSQYTLLQKQWRTRQRSQTAQTALMLEAKKKKKRNVSPKEDISWICKTCVTDEIMWLDTNTV